MSKKSEKPPDVKVPLMRETPLSQWCAYVQSLTDDELDLLGQEQQKLLAVYEGIAGHNRERLNEIRAEVRRRRSFS